MFELYRLPSAPDPSSPYFVYPTSLFSLDLGYALWYPEPHESGQPQIGDVGYIRDGAFIRLFNINAARPEHKVVFWGDDAFEPEDPPSKNTFRLDKRQQSINRGHFPSHGVRQKEMGGSLSLAFSEAAAALSAGYSCKEAYGAVLVLDSQGRSEKVFESRPLTEYMARQHEQWCAYVRDVLKQRIDDEEIVLIGGWVRTSADWATMAFSKQAKKHSASLKGQGGGLLGLEIFGSRMRAQSGPSAHREGSKYPRAKHGGADAAFDEDQSIFLTRYKIKRRFGVVKMLVAGAGYHTLPRDSRDDDDGDGVHDSVGGDMMEQDDGLRWLEYKAVIDPLDILLDYILEVSGADIAVGSDRDLASMIGHNPSPMDFASHLRRTKPDVHVENNRGIVSIPDFIFREQYTKFHYPHVPYRGRYRRIQTLAVGSPKPKIMPVMFSDEISPFTSLPAKLCCHQFEYGPSKAPEHPPSTFALSLDGTILACTSNLHGRVVAWSLRDGLVTHIFAKDGLPGQFTSIAISPQNSSIVTGSTDNAADIWVLSKGAFDYRPVGRLVGHWTPVQHVTFTTDGSRIVTAAQNSSVMFWHANSGFPLCHYALHQPIDELLHSANGSRLAVRMRRSVALFNVTPGESITLLATLDAGSAPHAEVRGIAFSPQGDRLLVLSLDEQGSPGRIYDTKSCTSAVTLEPFGEVLSATFSPDGEHFLTVSQHSAIMLWYARDGTIVTEYRLDMPATAAAFSPNGRFIAAAGGLEEGNIRAWERSGQLVIDYKSDMGEFNYIRFLPDSDNLLTVSTQQAARLWNIGDALRLL
ncbi:WD40 repeat domain-containing protein [Phanerochaete sordida]|uniref:WD40 repeat domain-containing protein n=1 Tax=Phanerochaete sordida TaxID=48140 RepID=A0A9P3GHE1_9APHY|nr:WD40 repeat domain-containing protein [Phanerochaete sordida]